LNFFHWAFYRWVKTNLEVGCASNSQKKSHSGFLNDLSSFPLYFTLLKIILKTQMLAYFPPPKKKLPFPEKVLFTFQKIKEPLFLVLRISSMMGTGKKTLYFLFHVYGTFWIVFLLV